MLNPDKLTREFMETNAYISVDDNVLIKKAIADSVSFVVQKCNIEIDRVGRDYTAAVNEAHKYYEALIGKAKEIDSRIQSASDKEGFVHEAEARQIVRDCLVENVKR